MRLFPHTWEGLHPAFPSNPSPSGSHISIGPPFAHPSLGIVSGQSYGICALACVAAAGVIKHSNSLPAQRTVGFLFKTTALAATLGAAGSINHELGERRAASTFLRSRHIEPPPFKLVDRFASWDADDWSMSGGLAGLFAASRRPCPLPSVSRTVWYAIHIMSGVCIAGLGHAAQEVATVGRKLAVHRVTHEKPVAMLQRVSYSPEVAREQVLDLLASVPDPLRQVRTGAIKLSPEMIAALIERETSWSFGPRQPAKDPQIANEELHKNPNYSDGFHKTHKPLDKYEPVPYAERNYDWSHSSRLARAIPELEDHIAKLRVQRQRVCKEAESVRDWLHEREAAYFNLKATATGNETDKLQTDKHYLEVLSHWYLATWITVSECDWMLAGATEHLTLARKATQQGLDWPPPPAQPGKSPNVKLEYMLLGLELRLNSMRDSSRQAPGAVAMLKKALKEDPNITGPQRAAIEGQIRSFEHMQKALHDDMEVHERVLADAKKRSENGSDESSTTE